MKASTIRHGMNLWPPFLFAGIHVSEISADWRRIRVELRMRPWNRNYVKTHFGGSLFAMTDPFRMIPVLRSLGSDYIVWDKAGEIEYVAPGRGTVSVEFRIEEADLVDMRAATADGGKFLRWFPVEVRARDGGVVARVRKQLYVRRKESSRGMSAGKP